VIAGRPLALWNSFVVALGAAVIAVAKTAGFAVDPELVGFVTAVVFAVMGLLANQADNGSLLGRAK
jgi:hypothetical protein